MNKVFALILIFFGLLSKGQSDELSVNFSQAFILPSQLVIKDGSLSFRIRISKDSVLTEVEEMAIPDFQLQKFNTFLKDYKFTLQDYSIPPGFCADIIDGDTIITSHKMNLSVHPTKVSGKYILNDSVQLFEFKDPHPKSKDSRFVRELFELIFEGVDNLAYLEKLYGQFDEEFSYYQKDTATICVFGKLNVAKQFVELIDFYRLVRSIPRDTVSIYFSGVYRNLSTSSEIIVFLNQIDQSGRTILILNPTEEIEKIIRGSDFDHLVIRHN